MTDMEIVYGGIKYLKLKVGIESSSTDALWKQICSAISPFGSTVKLRRSRHKFTLVCKQIYVCFYKL